jgi:hypothetical protein
VLDRGRVQVLPLRLPTEAKQTLPTQPSPIAAQAENTAALVLVSSHVTKEMTHTQSPRVEENAVRAPGMTSSIQPSSDCADGRPITRIVQLSQKRQQLRM